MALPGAFGGEGGGGMGGATYGAAAPQLHRQMHDFFVSCGESCRFVLCQQAFLDSKLPLEHCITSLIQPHPAAAMWKGAGAY